jgi:chromosome segregation ATPase
MHENRPLVSHDYDQSDVMRLKAHLERAEVELLRLKDAQDLRTTALDPAAKELKAALAASEEALRIARKKEQVLAEELEDTKAILASLEASSRSKHHESLAEVQSRSSRIGLLESEAEKAQKRADEALELCRLEAEELRSEIRRLSHELDDEISRSHHEALWERLKERLEFEFTLEEKEEEGKSFAERIKKLEASLAKAEREALESADRKPRIENLSPDCNPREMDRLQSGLEIIGVLSNKSQALKFRLTPEVLIVIRAQGNRKYQVLQR